MPYLVLPPTGAGLPVLVIHSWWGLTASFTANADRLAGRGFLAGCADLYGGKIAATEAGARALRATPRRKPMYTTLNRYIATLRTHPASTGNGVGLVGFSMGGHWAVWLAQCPDPPVAGRPLLRSTRR